MVHKIFNICDNNEPLTNVPYAAYGLRKAFSQMMAEELGLKPVGDYKLTVQ
jgi:hypothetical protein